MEEWKVLDFDNKYSVSSFGRVKSPRCILAMPKSGRIKFGNGKKTHQVHRLVACAFIPNVENKPNVSHIDGDKTNNKVENLRWSNHNEFAKKASNLNASLRKIGRYSLDGKFIDEWKSQTEALKTGVATSSPGIIMCLKGKTKKHAGYIWKYLDDDNLPDEEWRKIIYKGKEVVVSSCGRVEHKNGKKTFGNLQKNGYMRIHIKKAGESIYTSVHSLVATAFCSEGKTEERNQVNHRDGNKRNNRYTNLEWVTSSENIQHAFDTGLNIKKA